MVTAFARLEGRPVGLIANQPRQLGGVIDAAASEKAALFVEDCNRFGLPLVVFVDTPGFMPGKRQEEAGGDPPRRLAAARLRRRLGAEGDAGPAQGLRRRGDHDELQRPRRRRRLLLARTRRSGSWPRARRSASSTAGAMREDETLSRDDLADAYAAEHLTAPGRRRQRLGRRGDRARGEPREPRLGAALPEGTLSVASPADPPTADRAGRIVSSYAALGDSFTAGRDSIDAERWADLLAAGDAAGQPGAALREPRRRRRDQRRSARPAGRAGAGAASPTSSP